MKVKLLLQISTWFEKDYEPEDKKFLELLLIIDNNPRNALLFRSDLLDDTDLDKLFSAIEGALNESTIWINAIPGLRLFVDQSVSEFIEGREEEIRNFVKQLIIEI